MPGQDPYDPALVSWTVYNEPLEFTGKELDKHNTFEYSYFGARYYDADLGRFSTCDPLMDKYPSISPYAYCANNPILYVDPDGQETRIYSRPVLANNRHIFIVVKNENMKIHTSIGYFPENRAAGVSNYYLRTDFESGNKVVLKRNLNSELGEVKKLESGQSSNVKLEAIIEPPEGMTEDQYDNAVIDAANNHPIEEIDYNLSGPNSNTIVDDVIERTGAIMPDIPDATAQNHGEAQAQKRESNADKGMGQTVEPREKE